MRPIEENKENIRGEVWKQFIEDKQQPQIVKHFFIKCGSFESIKDKIIKKCILK